MAHLMETIGSWATANWQGVSLATIITMIAAIVAYHFTKVTLPKMLDMVLNYLVKIIAKMFGQDVDDVSDKVNKLDIINDLKDWRKSINAQNEIKLIETKNKLISPKLTEAERAAYQGVFDKLKLDIGEGMSLGTIKLLDALDNKAKEALEKLDKQ